MKDDKKKSLTFHTLLASLESFIDGLKGSYNSMIAGAKAKKGKIKDGEDGSDEKFDISVDDIQKAYKDVPKKIGYITIGLSFLIILLMTLVTVGKQVSAVDEKRKKVKKEKLKEGEVEISIDEQGWKHYQSKRIDFVMSSTKKQLEENKKDMERTSKALEESVKKELNTTVNTVKTYMEEFNKKLVAVQTGIDKKLDSKMSEVDKKVQENKKFVESYKFPTNTGQQFALNENSVMLPPPLKGLNSKDQSDKNTNIKDGVEDNETNTTYYTNPDDDDYNYYGVEVDDFEIMTSSISTLVDENQTRKSKSNFHIMKGLVHATLLTGINAATFGGGSSRNPFPVLFSVDGDTFIANNEYETIEDCLIAGSATGNINTSRADVLLTEISCSGYNKAGKRVKIEKSLKGWAIGEDGTAGLSGRLLDSSGKVITKMIAIELIKSMSDMMVATAQPQGTAIGTATNPLAQQQSAGNRAQSTMGSGVSKGLDYVYEHYSEILSGMYPVISVRAGKKITLHLKGGEDIEPVVYDTVDINEEFEVE